MIRRAYLAGQWYPGERSLCREAIAGHLDWGAPPEGDFRALIAPHAGWFYSGNAMGVGYKSLLMSRKGAEIVVVFGSHRGVEGPNTIYCGAGWDTPLGEIQTPLDMADFLRTENSLSEEPITPSRFDNAVEVHLPFVRLCFPITNNLFFLKQK